MAATKTQNPKHDGNPNIHSLTSRGGCIEQGALALDNSYPTGGYAIEFGFIPAFLVTQVEGNYIGEYDNANEKVKIKLVSTGAEVAAATDLSSVTMQYLAMGWQ